MDRDIFEKLYYIIDFKKYIENKNYSYFTLKNYINDLYYFYKYINKSIIDVSSDDVRNYLSYMNKIKKSTSSICRSISSLKTFYKFLIHKNIINDNPMNKVYYPKKEKKLPKFLYYNELIEIINETNNDKDSVRDKLIIEMLYATGVRVSELVNIKISDIDFNNRRIVVLGKGNKERVVYYGEYASDVLNEYLSMHSGNKYLFLNSHGEKISEGGVRYILDEIMKKLSIKTHVTPHVLRHTFATDMLNNGCDIKIVSEILGHASLSSTEVYTHVTNERIKEVYYNCFKRSE